MQGIENRFEVVVVVTLVIQVTLVLVLQVALVLALQMTLVLVLQVTLESVLQVTLVLTQVTRVLVCQSYTGVIEVVDDSGVQGSTVGSVSDLVTGQTSGNKGRNRGDVTLFAVGFIMSNCIGVVLGTADDVTEGIKLAVLVPVI